MKHRKSLLMTCLIFFFACNGAPENKQSIQSLASLQEIDSCDALLRSLKDRAILEMEQQIDKNLEYALQGDYCYDRGGGYVLTGEEMNGDYDSATIPAPSEGNGEQASQYSETNTQVAGVDEADFVKNDGGTIYILAGGKFKIIDAWPPEESRVIASYPVEGEPKKLYVSNGRALIYSALDASGDTYYGTYGGECTYGYDCDFTGDGRPLKITVLDISDLEAPVLLRETRLSGSYVNSRRIGPAVYTVVSFPEIHFPGISTWPEDLPRYCTDDGGAIFARILIRVKFKELKEANRRIIEDTRITDWIPGLADTLYVGGSPFTSENILGGCEGFYESGLGDGRLLLTILSMSMETLDPVATATIVGRPGAVYASKEALYIASRHDAGYGGWSYDESGSIQQATTVHKFALLGDPPGALYAASGVVKGNVLNQFSMDEHEGYLRLATTTGHVPDPNVHSTVSILAERSGELKLAGQVDNIAPTEDIRSARFSGDRGFIVTFKKTDPLFVLDLSDPGSPSIAGELHIPGFSTYMHMMDETHLLTIGYDADDQGSFAWFQGIQLQVFDISNMADPRLSAREVIGTRGSTSDAATNHLAFNYFPPKDLLALPMMICEGGSGGTYGDIMTFSGLLVYRVTVEEGFGLLGRVSHEAPETEETYRYACSNWWTDSNSQVKRSIVMDDTIFSVALDQIKVQSLGSIGTDLAVIGLLD
jgi:hypothetical protein